MPVPGLFHLILIEIPLVLSTFFMNYIVVVVSITAADVFGIILINRDSLYENTITKDAIM